MTHRLLTFALILVVGLAGGFGLATFGPWSPKGGPQKEESGEKKILYWVAPMDPNYRRDEPGKSPMGMDLVPVYEEEATSGAEASSVQIDPSVVNNIGVRTVKAERAVLRPPIYTVGRISFDEERVAQIHLRSEGWIERLAVRAEGEVVAQGDLLFEVYSPDLINAQSEFLQSLRSGRQALVEASRGRLRALDISDDQIAELEQTRKAKQYVSIYAPINGVVTALNVADGKFVKPDTQIMALADLSAVWLMSDVFESQAGQLRLGASVKARSKFESGETIEGRVDYVYPDLDPTTRTVLVRTILDNAAEKLKPGMFMTVEIEGPPRPEATIIPREALIRTGRQERVILALGDGRFQPAAVTSGMEADGQVEILSGLAADEAVVVSGQFLIDSESSFAGASLRLQSPKGAEAVRPEIELPGHSDAHPISPLAQGFGVIKTVKMQENVITLSHEPIAELGWPAMIMDLPVTDAVDLGAIQEGARVHFFIDRREDQSYVISKVETAP